MSRLASLLIGILLLFFGAFATSEAQSSLAINISPEYPRPGDNIFLSLESYSIDLRNSLIRWTVNGSVVKEEIGGRRISVEAGGAGSSVSIAVSVTTQLGETYQDGLVIYPAEVNLLWESDGYAPPFYEGGAPYAFGGRLTFTAIPEFFKNGARVNPKNLTYVWSQNGKVVQGASGYGRSTFTTNTVSYLRGEQDVSVEVSSPTENFVAQTSVSLPYSSPKVLFYEDHPLYGTLFNRALPNQIALTNNEITILQVPYFFSDIMSDDPEKVTTAWAIDGVGADGYRNRDKITIRKTGPDAGASSIEVSVQHRDKSVQTAEESILVLVRDND